MKLTGFAALCGLFLTMSLPLYAAPVERHHHPDSDGREATQLKLDAGKKWMTDLPLRQSMGKINQAMVKAVPLIHTNQFTDKQYLALAETIRQEVAYAVERCHLAPKADAMLHLVIADLLAGAEALERADSRHDGAVKILKALQGYGGYFHHPGWKTAGSETN